MPARTNRPDKMGAPSPHVLVETVDSTSAARALAAHLLDPGRTRPVVVISAASGQPAPFIDPEAVVRALGDLAEVRVVPTNEVSRELARALPEFTQVYGGAGRVYPIGREWTADYRLSPLRFAHSAQEGARAGELLAGDAIAMAARAGIRRLTTGTRRDVSGTVSALFPPARAVVTVDDGMLATVWQELTTPCAPIDRILARGQRVRGLLDDTTGRLDVASSVRTATDALRGYEPGVVVLAQVAAVAADAVTVLLYPGVIARIRRGQVTSNDLDPLDDLFSTGEVLTARIEARAGETFELRLDDVGAGEAVLPAPCVVDGGPPWLEVRATEVSAGPRAEGEAPLAVVAPPSSASEPVVDEASAPIGPPASVLEPIPGLVSSSGPHSAQLTRSPAPVKTRALESLGLALDAERAKSRRLEERVESVAAECQAMEAERTDLRRLLADAEADLDRATWQAEHERTRRRASIMRDTVARNDQRTAQHVVEEAANRDLDAFVDPETQFRHEVYLAWTRRIGKSEKEHRPLAPYTLGDRFLVALEVVEGVDRCKVVDVVVEVLTGLAADVAGRELHRLRTSSGGGCPPVVRGDGATCWRASLQRSTPSARRLHFWRTSHGFEFERVVTHDEVEP